jgi:tetratricopeptide (TPR) repeat protein
MGAHADAQQYLEESLAIAREIEDRSRVAAVLQPLGMAALGQGDFATAHARLDEALTLAETMRNEREIAAALSAMAQLRRVEGALDDAESLNLRALEICRKLGDRESIATGQLNLAMVAIGRRGATLAREMLLQGMTIAQEIGSKMAGQSAIEVAAGLAAMLGHWPQAARFFGAAEAQAAQTGIRRDAADEAFLAPLMALGREALGAEGFAEAERAGKLLPFESAIADARAWVESAA